MGSGLDASLTGSGRLEVALVGAIVVLAVFLLFFRFLRSSNQKRRRGASAYFDKSAANRGRSDRDTSTGTSVYPSTRPGVPQPMAPSFAAPLRGMTQKDDRSKQGRTGPTPAPPPAPGPGTAANSSATAAGVPPFVGPAPGVTTPSRAAPPVKSPVLDPVPPLRSEGITMPPDRRSAPQGTGSVEQTPASRRTAVPANLPPMTPPPSAGASPPTPTGAGAEADDGPSHNEESDPPSDPPSDPTTGPDADREPDTDVTPDA